MFSVAVMLRRLSAVSLLAAWLCASGALLQAVQLFAWARMFTGYATQCSVGEAAVRTFDPAHPCALCRAVQKAAAAQSGTKAPAAPAIPLKILLFCSESKTALPRPDLPGWERMGIEPPPSPWREVALRPPRAQA